MADKEINDFICVLGAGHDAELETYRLFAINDDVKIKNNRMLLDLRAVDVPVRRQGGWHFFQLLFGRKPIAGGVDLSKKREASLAEDLTFQVKIGKPSIWLAFPNAFEELPQTMRQNQGLADALRLFYAMRRRLQEEEQTLADAGYQQSEITDRLAASQTQLSNFMFENLEKWKSATQKTEKSEAPKDETGEKKQYY